MSREVVVLGAGVHPFGKFPDKSFVDLGVYAARQALNDAGLEWSDMQIVASGVDSFGGTPGRSPALLFARALGQTGVTCINASNACATGSACLRTLYAMIAAGMYDLGIAIGSSVSPGGFFPPHQVAGDSWWDTNEVRFSMVGITNPVYWAMEATRRMHAYGLTERHLAKIKVKYSKAGSLNPNSRYKKVYTIEDVLNSPMVCYPFRLFEICATSDGAAAAVLCAKDVAKRYTTNPITLASASLASPLFGDATLQVGQISTIDKPGVPRLSEVGIAAKMAFEESGVGPEDLDFLEICDNSAWHELEYLERIGLCAEGESEKLIEEGYTDLGGKMPVNPSGGFSSFGEAVAAMGIWHLCEITWQLRGQVGPRQVENAKVGYGQCLGHYGQNGAMVLKK